MRDTAIAGLLFVLAIAGAETGIAEAQEEIEPEAIWSGAVPEAEPECVASIHLYLGNPRESGGAYGHAEVGSRRCASPELPALAGAATEPGEMSTERVRGAWVWREAVWAEDPAALIESAQAAGLSVLYIAVPIRQGAIERPDALSRLIRRANARGVAVHAVEGDPRMISGYGLEHARQRAQALAHFNAAYPRTPLSGLQYDIEPYLLDQYASAPVQTFAQWAQALAALSAAYGEPVEIVVPFWITAVPGGAAALAAAAPSATRLTVMAYRTTPEAILQAATPLLSWGDTYGVPVAVALEMGALPDETAEVYRREDSGELTLADTGEAANARLHGHTVLGREGQPAFTYSHSVTIPASRISFSGDYAALASAAEAVEPRFLDFRSYAGLVIHGLIE